MWVNLKSGLEYSCAWRVQENGKVHYGSKSLSTCISVGPQFGI